MQHLWDVGLKQVRVPSAALAIPAHLAASLPSPRHLVPPQRPQLLSWALLQLCAPSHNPVSSLSSAGASHKAPPLRECSSRLHGTARSRQACTRPGSKKLVSIAEVCMGWVPTPGCSVLQSVAGAVSDPVHEASAQCAQASYGRARCVWLCSQHQELSYLAYLYIYTSGGALRAQH